VNGESEIGKVVYGTVRKLHEHKTVQSISRETRYQAEAQSFCQCQCGWIICSAQCYYL